MRVSVQRDAFVPVEFEIGATHDGISSRTSLSSEKPSSIRAEPAYRGQTQLYGSFPLGTAPDNTYWFCVDLISPSRAEMYFDRNHNGNLSDDGGPIVNQGTRLFAAKVSVPFQQLVPESRYTSDFVFWFYGNELFGIPPGMDHYSRTQLKGSVRLAGVRYTAYLAERGGNDADLTNDGIYIDVNRDGRIDTEREWYPADQAVALPGGEVIFRISW